MIILDTTTRSLEIDLTGAVAANQLPFVASYVDMAKGTMEVIAASTNTGTSSDTTAVTLVAAPANANFTRQLKYLSIRNADTAAVPMWIQVNDNATLREIWKGTLAVDDSLVYTDTLGFNVLDSTGRIKHGSGVNGPSSSTDNAVARFNGTGGTAIQNSAVIIDDSNNVTGVVALTASGLITGSGGFSGVIGATGAAAGTFTTGAFSSTVTLSGVAANIAIGANFISYAGTDAGFSLDASNNATLSGTLTVSGANGLTLSATASPTGTGTGVVGQIAWDTAYLYVCTATNDWRRIALVDF